MIDTHCHLTDERLHMQLDDVLRRAQSAGVERMITVSTGVEDAIRCINLARQHDHVRCTAGIHPNYSHEADLSHIPRLRELAGDPQVVALGEMGLDYHHEFSQRDHQAQIFQAQLELARELKMPVVIHCREAVDDTLVILKTASAVPAVFHCFTGSVNEARRILDSGYLIGFTGVVTFKKSTELQEVAGFVPADRFLVETDAPYLSPEPMRKVKVNEPAFVMHTATAVAAFRGVSIEEIDELTTRTAQRFFRW